MSLKTAVLSVLCSAAAVFGPWALASSFRSEPITPINFPEVISEQMLLGRQLFFDTRLSAANDYSCASCHDVSSHGADGQRTAQRPDGGWMALNSPTIFNLVYNHRFGWRGNLRNLHLHLEGLFAKGSAMGLSTEKLLAKLATTEYPQIFDKLYVDGLNERNLIAALVAYESALTTPSAFDRYLLGEQDAISPAAAKGYVKFQQYGCISCHQGSNIGGNLYQKLGVMRPYYAEQRPAKPVDFGRYKLTGLERDKFFFRVPSLRNVSLTAPYLHDGSIETLAQVINIMAEYQLGVTIPEQDVELLTEFLQSLQGSVHPRLLAP